MRSPPVVVFALAASLALAPRLAADDLAALARRYAASGGAIHAAGTARVPPFSRQTGLACSACHYQFLSLTPLGREFKLNGYTLSALQVIREKDSANGNTLRLSPIPLVGAMLQASFTQLRTAIPGTQNGSVAMPQQLSLFLAGQLTSKVGLFSQVTYSGADGAIGIDNVDLRYADQADIGKTDLAWGVSLNNNPTVSDLWNTTPAWGFPYAAPDAGVGPLAATLVDGGLAQSVLGLTAYALAGNTVYGEFGVYRSAEQGKAQPDSTSSGTIRGVAPYWRLGLQHSWGRTYAMLGTFGLRAVQYPAGLAGATDKRTDVGVDLQVEQKAGTGAVVLRAAYVHESGRLDGTFAADGSDTPTVDLNTVKANLSWYPRQWIGLTGGYFQATGTRDATFYGAEAVTGSASGDPKTRGFIGELDLNPWQNTRLGIQYTAYDRFNGGSTNYDGAGRSASANDTLYLLAWFVF